MKKEERSNKQEIAKTLIVYLGGAWVFIEAINFLIDKYDWNTTILDVLILLVIFGLPAILIYTWFHQKFTRKAIVLQAINGVIALAVIVFTLANPGKLDPTQLRLLKFKDNQKQLAESIRSIVILPFDNYTGTDEFEYYFAGMHDGLIGDLGKISALRVTSKTSSRLYKDVDMSIPEIASELNVDAVIEASVSCIAEDSVCIRIRLVSAFPEEQQLWVQDYYEDKSQILNLYNRVTKQISEEINIVLTPQEENLLADTKPVNPEAYDAYLNGIYYFYQMTPEALQKALDYFELAIEKDPDWGPPYAGIAEFWIGMRQMGLAPSTFTIPKIYEYLDKATELDPNSANTHYVNALAAVWTGFNWEKGEREFLKALEINPNDAYCRVFYAHLLTSLKRTDEALLQGQLALELDPLNTGIQALYAVVLANAGDYDQSIPLAKEVLSVVPGQPLALAVLSLVHLFEEEYKKSLQYWTLYLHLEEDTRQAILETFDNLGFHAAMEEFIIEVEKSTGDSYPMDLAQLYMINKNYPKAFDWFDVAFKAHDANLPYLSTLFFSFDTLLVNDPRYIELLKKMNLPMSENE